LVIRISNEMVIVRRIMNHLSLRARHATVQGYYA
jgi:hypothetical protein